MIHEIYFSLTLRHGDCITGGMKKTRPPLTPAERQARARQRRAERDTKLRQAVQHALKAKDLAKAKAILEAAL
jgi:hypothetical protein